MSFLSALFGSKTRALAPGRGWVRHVVGEASFQEALTDIYYRKGGVGHDLKVDATCVPEANNRHDANAVRVEISGRTVGYLPRQDAVEYRNAIGAAKGTCSAKIVGGFERDDETMASFGVRLNMSWPPKIT